MLPDSLQSFHLRVYLTECRQKAKFQREIPDLIACRDGIVHRCPGLRKLWLRGARPTYGYLWTEDDEGRVPGRKMKRQRPVLDPELTLVGALIEGRVFSVEKVKDVSKLPTLETLRQQIVGLISSPAVQLAMVLGEASGGKLARTLEGLKKGLEEGTQSKQEEISP